MAQTTGGMNSVNGKVELSTDGIPTWTDISGFLNMVDPGQGVRQTGDVFTADGDTPIIGAGKRERLTLTVNIVYTEGGSDPFKTIQTAFENGDVDIQLRWSPNGGGVGDYQFTSAQGHVSNFSYPPVDPSNAAPIVLSFQLATPYYTQDAAT